MRQIPNQAAFQPTSVVEVIMLKPVIVSSIVVFMAAAGLTQELKPTVELRSEY